MGKRELFLIRDVVSPKRKPYVDRFLTLCRQHFQEDLEESCIAVELTCAYTKNDDFNGLQVLQ